MKMNITKHMNSLKSAQELVKEYPELHAEYERRRNAGEFFEQGEPVAAFYKKLMRLNSQALKAVGI